MLTLTVPVPAVSVSLNAPHREPEHDREISNKSPGSPLTHRQDTTRVSTSTNIQIQRENQRWSSEATS